MATEKIVDRIRKLLELSHSSNEHEASQAAARAAEMMNEHAVSEAMLQVVTDEPAPYVPERIVEGDPTYESKRRVAWRDRIASAIARSFDCETYYSDGGLYALGRESNVAAWRYTCQYLFGEVERLADEAWLREGADLAAVGQMPRAWKGAFRLGAADVVHERVYKDYYARREKEKTQMQQLAEASIERPGIRMSDNALVHVRTSEALAVLAKDRKEVVDAYTRKTKGWRSTRSIGAGRGRSGYYAGREAGAGISLGGGRKALRS